MTKAELHRIICNAPDDAKVHYEDEDGYPSILETVRIETSLVHEIDKSVLKTKIILS